MPTRRARRIRVCLAGATGWIGRALVPAIASATDLELVGAVSRSAAGGSLESVLGHGDSALEVRASVELALQVETDVLIDFTGPEAVKSNVLTALRHGVHAVVGTSGLTRPDYDEIEHVAASRGLGVIAAGNFAISAVLLQHFAAIAARHLPSWEVVDYASADKPDAPSGTARELCARLAGVGRPEVRVPIDETQGAKEARGLSLRGTQVHSLRLPGFTIGTEVIFGREGERLVLRHEGGESPEPYVAGTLLATRRVIHVEGLVRGLDRLLSL
jgi:4-hydroxy-tetrahydrodipicolinate reductase